MMKSISQKDLQSLYLSPSAEDTEAMRNILSELPMRESTGRTAGFVKHRLAFVIAAVLLLVIGITAAAISRTGPVWVTWGGKQLDLSQSTPFPEEDDGWTDEKGQQMQEMLETVPDEYYGTIDWLNGFAGSKKPLKRKIYSLDSLLEILDEAGYPHPSPLIPDGYSFNDAEVLLGCTPEDDYQLVSEIVENGFSLEQYRIDPAAEVIIGYNIHVWDKDEQSCAMHAIVSELTDSDQIVFGFDDSSELTTESLSVPGMEEALCLRYGENWEDIEMLRKLDNPVPVRTNPLAFAADLPEMPKPTSTYLYEHYATLGIPPEDVLPLFSGTPDK